jgi:hypothetical protein
MDRNGKESFKPFLLCLEQLGYSLIKQDASNRMFVNWVLKLRHKRVDDQYLQMRWPPLKACLYKRR